MVARTGKQLPRVYNTSGYERPEILEEFKDLADIYLTDLRYADEASAREGSQAAGYVAAAREALATMWRLAGPVRTDAEQIAVSGTICRVLVLPGRAKEAIDNLRWMAENIGTGISLSLMSQYRPLYKAQCLDSWSRRVSQAEYEEVCGIAETLGFTEGWIQEYEGQTPPDLVGNEMKEGDGVVGKQVELRNERT